MKKLVKQNQYPSERHPTYEYCLCIEKHINISVQWKIKTKIPRRRRVSTFTYNTKTSLEHAHEGYYSSLPPRRNQTPHDQQQSGQAIIRLAEPPKAPENKARTKEPWSTEDGRPDRSLPKQKQKHNQTTHISDQGWTKLQRQ